MRTSMSLPVRRLLAALALALLAAPLVRADQPVKGEEAAHVRFLIVVDTDDREGATWGLDGKNLKAVLEAGLEAQTLNGRYTIDMVTGRHVAPGHVLKYYRDVKVGPRDTLVFYYSGHGGYNTTKGHFMSFTHGRLYRKTLLAAMQEREPRLAVLLTDCCADYEGGVGPPETPLALPKPPPPGKIQPGKVQPGKIQPGTAVPGVIDIPGVPTANPVLPGRKAAAEPPQKPKQQKLYVPQVHGDAPPGAGVVLRTGSGPLSLQRITEETDGAVMRHLFYRHSGLVDINGCQRGKSSHGTIPWGGSLFTIGFLSLQKDAVAKFDANRNGLVEWTEFFPHLRTSCERAGLAVSNGKIRQVPEATQLGQPVLAVAAQ